MKKIEQLMDSPAIDRCLGRIAHQILERNRDPGSIGIVGMQSRGVFLASRLAETINRLEGTALVAGTLDVTLYRDDWRMAFKQPAVKITEIPFDINGKDIILVDDVLYTGRTVRAALSAIMDFGRPRSIQLAVLVDRGGRELPIAADYSGLTRIPQANQEIRLSVKELDDEDSLWLTQIAEVAP